MWFPDGTISDFYTLPPGDGDYDKPCGKNSFTIEDSENCSFNMS